MGDCDCICWLFYYLRHYPRDYSALKIGLSFAILTPQDLAELLSIRLCRLHTIPKPNSCVGTGTSSLSNFREDQLNSAQINSAPSAQLNSTQFSSDQLKFKAHLNYKAHLKIDPIRTQHVRRHYGEAKNINTRFRVHNDLFSTVRTIHNESKTVSSTSEPLPTKFKGHSTNI